MQGFTSMEKAAESLRHLNCRWYSAFDSSKPLSFDELLKIAKIYDADSAPDVLNCFISLEDSGEIGIVYPREEKVEFLFLPEGSRYKGQSLNQEILYAEADAVIQPLMRQMLVEQAKRSARVDVIASHYSIDERGQVVGHSPIALRWPYEFEKPGMTLFTDLRHLEGKASRVYGDIFERVHDGKKAKVDIAKKGSKNTAAAVGKREVWRKINSYAAGRAGIGSKDRNSLKDFQWDNETQRRSGLSATVLRSIKSNN